MSETTYKTDFGDVIMSGEQRIPRTLNGSDEKTVTVSLKVSISEYVQLSNKYDFNHLSSKQAIEKLLKENDVVLSDLRTKQTKPATAKTDKTGIDYTKIDTALIKNKFSKDDRIERLKEVGATDDDLKALNYIKDEQPSTDDIIKMLLNSGVK